jgi:serine protease Do
MIMRFLPSRLAAVAVLAVCAGSLFAAESGLYSRRSPVVEAVQKTKASIVTIQVPRQDAKDLTGSGVIIDERGFIVTNHHVVGSRRQVNVRLHDGTVLSGNVLVVEPSWDLAIVRIEVGKRLPALGLTSVADLMVGETVIALGHPYGYTDTVSTGIVSALDREITMPTGNTISGLIQTNAAINPGNSGGALVNINGELIGINVAVREGAQGIAFAINASTVRTVLNKHFSTLRVGGSEHVLEKGPEQGGRAPAGVPATGLPSEPTPPPTLTQPPGLNGSPQSTLNRSQHAIGRA